MRLYLSSENVGNHADCLSKMVGGNKSVAYISNAKDYSEEDLKIKIPIHKAEFESRGFKFKEFDLRKYIGKSDKLEEEISKFGLIWGTGGNTFLLRRAMYDSGLDKILVKLLKKNQLVYGGSSAGSIVACPSLRGTECGDDPSAVNDIYKKEVVWDGLDLVDFYLTVHYKSDWFGRQAQDMVNFFVKNNMDYKILRDGQVWIVDGDRQELLV